MSRFSSFDQDALIAGADLVRRSGARQFEVGYLHDDVPTEEAGWYAHAQYKGHRVIVENKPGPIEAVEGLARRLLADATCRRCGNRISLSEEGEGICRWTRLGKRWGPGCDLPIDYTIPTN